MYIKYDDIEKKVTIKLYNMGLTYNEISSGTGISKPSVSLIFRKARKDGMNISQEKSNVKRLNQGIKRYFTEMYEKPYSGEINQRVKEIFEKKILNKTIEDVKKKVNLEDILAPSDPEQKLLHSIFGSPEYSPDLTVYMKSKKENQDNNFTLDDFKSHIRADYIYNFQKNYIPPELIDPDVIKKALNTLPTRDRVILWKNIALEYTQTEIGKKLERSRARIGQLRDRALRNLRYNQRIMRYNNPKNLSEYINMIELENKRLRYELEVTKNVLNSGPEYLKTLLEQNLKPIKSDQKKLQSPLYEPIDEIPMSHRHYNLLKKMDINIIKELAEKTEKEMLSTRGIWRKTLDYYKSILAERNLRFGMKFD